LHGPGRRWRRPLPLVGLTIVVVGCSLSLRGGGNPIGAPNGTPTPFAAGGPPTVVIASPATGTTGATGQTITFDVRASDSYPVGVARLELFAGETLVDRALTPGGANKASFGAILEWTPLLPGPYQISAVAYRADGTASEPAIVRLVITGPAISALPSQTLVPLITPSPSLIPTFSPIPTPSPSPTPKPTPKPTKAPTPPPVGVRIEVWVVDADLPNWNIGQSQALIIHVQNIGGAAVPYVRVVATLANSTAKVRTGSLNPGQETTVSVVLTPAIAGDQKLSVVGKLPVGYFDSDPASNTLVWEKIVTVSPAPTAPPPTATP
jgi:Bacterial Ig domain